jgi:hypothetical protein
LHLCRAAVFVKATVVLVLHRASVVFVLHRTVILSSRCAALLPSCHVGLNLFWCCEKIGAALNLTVAISGTGPFSPCPGLVN